MHLFWNDKHAFSLLNSLKGKNCGLLESLLCFSLSIGQYIYKILLEYLHNVGIPRDTFSGFVLFCYEDFMLSLSENN